MTRIIGYPRLHFALFDLGTATPRLYGGAGVAISGPTTVVTARQADRTVISGAEHLDTRGQSDLDQIVRRFLSARSLPPAAVEVETMPTQHVGLGTKTTVTLSALTAVSQELGADVTAQDLQRASGRGGTSGIGIHSFFHGGLIIDGGQPGRSARVYAPSSARPPADVPPMLCRIDMPLSWTMILLLPLAGQCHAGLAEAAVFDAMTPVPDGEVGLAVAFGLLGVAASAMSSDFDGFSRGLSSLQRVGFKAREIEAQSSGVRELMTALQAIPRCAVGMSSMGPLVFAVVEQENVEGREAVATIGRDHAATVLGEVAARNAGYEGA